MSNSSVSSMLFFTAAFVGGNVFSAAIFIWALRQKSAALEAVVDMKILVAFALRQLAFFLALAVGSAALCFFALSRFQPAPQAGPSTPAAPIAVAAVPSIAAAPPGTSRLTGIRFPVAMNAVQERDVIQTSSQQLQKLVRQVDAQSRLGQSEVLMWRENYQRTRAEAFIAQVQADMKNAGFLYQETGGTKSKDSAIREFVAVSRARKKVVPGFWMITDDFLLLSWGELVAS